MLIEIQGLAAKSGFGTPQRVATGYDGRRLALLLAVLDKRAGLSFSQLDVFLNVVGGVRMQEPAGDLAVAALSPRASTIVRSPANRFFLARSDLVARSGRCRSRSGGSREAAKMGMTTAFMSERAIPKRGPRKESRSSACAPSSDLFDQLFQPDETRRRRSHRRRGSWHAHRTEELKQFRWVAGKPMLLHSLQTFQQREPTSAMVVCRAAAASMWAIHLRGSFSATPSDCLLSVGGRERSDSVRNGLEDLPDEVRDRRRARCGASACDDRDDRRVIDEARKGMARSPGCRLSTR